MADRDRPVISVAIASRNYGRYLPRALDSVFRCHNPTAAPLQVVVADDASTDNTRAVLADYRLRYPNSLEVVPLRTAVGIGAAKYEAVARCAGRTIAALDADDEFLPEKLVYCHRALWEQGVDVVTSDFYLQTEEGDVRLVDRRTWSEWYWPPSTWVFRSGAVRFNRHCLGAEDLEWIERGWRSLRHRHLDLPLNRQYLHGSNHQWAWPSRITGSQAAGRFCDSPHPDDALAPRVWACRRCGGQYLLPARCCGREAAARPLYFYLAAFSPQQRAPVEFSVVMLTRNRLELTRRAVGSFLDRLPVDRRQEVELIIVDGGSTDGTIEYVRGLAESYLVKLIVTHPAEPFNYARACNRGARIAVGRYLLLVNNDIELRSEEPWAPLSAALEDLRVGVVGATTWWSGEQPDLESMPGSPPYVYVDRPLSGDFWGMRREVFWELGGIDEAFEGYGYDELDFEYRAQLAQYRLALARVTVHHDHHGTFGPLHGEAMEAMERENRWRFARKHGQPIRKNGRRVEPFAGLSPPSLSVVISARDEGPRLRETLSKAARDPRCGGGSVQIVVVDEGSTDDTVLVLEEYRLRLPQCLTVVTLEEPVGAPRARQIGQARATGREVRVLAPGDWQAEEPRSGRASGALPTGGGPGGAG